MESSRSSFFANEETFIAEKQLTKDESRLVKLIYIFPISRASLTMGWTITRFTS